MKDHFDKIYWYVCGSSAIVLFYVLMITFIDIPEKNQRFVDIALAFLLGWISNNSSYLTGGTPSQNKKQTDVGQTTAEINATITSNTKDTEI